METTAFFFGIIVHVSCVCSYLLHLSVDICFSTVLNHFSLLHFLVLFSSFSSFFDKRLLRDIGTYHFVSSKGFGTQNAAFRRGLRPEICLTLYCIISGKQKAA